MPMDFQMAMMKIDKEMEAAVAKHGKVTHPANSHIDDFYERIEKEKSNIATV
jgi:predicted  nucleic acid-binding Zn-ribbon protein